MRATLLLLLLTGCMCISAQQNNGQPLRSKVAVLRRFLEQNHYQPIQWNDSASMRLYDRWLEVLDDDKLIFSKAEFNALIPYRVKLDEEVLGREWGFFERSVQLYQSALLRADSLVRLIMAKPLDFSRPENLSWPVADYSLNDAALYETWQKYLKWKVLRSISDVVTNLGGGDGTSLPANFPQLEIKAREQVKKQELSWIQNKMGALEPGSKEMEDNFLSAITWCYDPHTEYMNSDTKTEFDTEMSGLEFSTGFEIDKNEKGEWIITYLVPGGPAWRSGDLHKGDVLIKIKPGNRPELVLADATMQQLSRVFEGGSNEKITITVRAASGVQKTAVLSKEKITNEEGIVKSYLLKGAKKIGYITLPGFYVKEGDEGDMNGCSNDVAKEVVKLKKDSIEGLILDLRYNGGGSLWEALELAGIFINEGSLTSTRDKAGKVHFLKDPNRGTIYDGPLLVMVNSLSASASELVSAVLQDYHRALIVGSTTYGKGSAQVILPMDTTGTISKTTKYDSYVKVTNSKFYRVDGSTNQWKGVVPDIELPDVYSTEKFKEKGTISALKPDMSRAAIYQPLQAIEIGALKHNSTTRVKVDTSFKAMVKFADWYRTSDGTRTIPLQWMGYNNYYKMVNEMYNSISADDDNNTARLVVTNNSLDMKHPLITAQTRAVNEINIERIAKDIYIAESFKIMEDWLK